MNITRSVWLLLHTLFGFLDDIKWVNLRQCRGLIRIRIILYDVSTHSRTYPLYSEKMFPHIVEHILCTVKKCLRHIIDRWKATRRKNCQRNTIVHSIKCDFISPALSATCLESVSSGYDGTIGIGIGVMFQGMENYPSQVFNQLGSSDSDGN